MKEDLKSVEKPSRETLEAWANDPSNWKYGVFYYNKKDKRFILPKRIKALGWTVNFAKPYAIPVLVGIIILIQIIAVLLIF